MELAGVRQHCQPIACAGKPTAWRAVFLGQDMKAATLHAAGSAGEAAIDDVVRVGPASSKICAPLYDCIVEMPILAMILSTPFSTPLQYRNTTSSSRALVRRERPSRCDCHNASKARYGLMASRSVSDQQAMMVHLPRFARLHHNARSACVWLAARDDDERRRTPAGN